MLLYVRFALKDGCFYLDNHGSHKYGQRNGPADYDVKLPLSAKSCRRKPKS